MNSLRSLIQWPPVYSSVLSPIEHYDLDLHYNQYIAISSSIDIMIKIAQQKFWTTALQARWNTRQTSSLHSRCVNLETQHWLQWLFRPLIRPVITQTPWRYSTRIKRNIPDFPDLYIWKVEIPCALDIEQNILNFEITNYILHEEVRSKTVKSLSL